jgi:hypothetical protein
MKKGESALLRGTTMRCCSILILLFLPIVIIPDLASSSGEGTEFSWTQTKVGWAGNRNDFTSPVGGVPAGWVTSHIIPEGTVTALVDYSSITGAPVPTGLLVFTMTSKTRDVWGLARVRRSTACTSNQYMIDFRIRVRPYTYPGMPGDGLPGDAPMTLSCALSIGPTHPGGTGFQYFDGDYYWMLWFEDNYYHRIILVYVNTGGARVAIFGPRIWSTGFPDDGYRTGTAPPFYSGRISVDENKIRVQIWEGASWDSGWQTNLLLPPTNPGWFLWLAVGGGNVPGNGDADYIIVSAGPVVVSGMRPGERLEVYSEGLKIAEQVAVEDTVAWYRQEIFGTLPYRTNVQFKLFSPGGSLLSTSPTYSYLYDGDTFVITRVVSYLVLTSTRWGVLMTTTTSTASATTTVVTTTTATTSTTVTYSSIVTTLGGASPFGRDLWYGSRIIFLFSAALVFGVLRLRIEPPSSKRTGYRRGRMA